MTTVNPSWAYALHLPHDPRAPGVARAHVRAVLAAHGLTELTPTAELLAAEMLNNAQLHTEGAYGLGLQPSAPDGVRVAVWDSSPVVPPGFGAAVSPDGGTSPQWAEAGRGLCLVRACSHSWGAYASPGRGGKLLWAACS
ncbi:ATP-binding protein [Streptomyces flavofungini]|uniref:ATP-binding protein n=1 Tax=Streptomyces flavofungini TaxID=68200 RepID=UPI0025B145AF|nr:ATP-binding protein [Streptomyces flavofungini]WJV47808.1 ATP-binding protein [Streptomyces flavofungini]